MGKRMARAFLFIVLPVGAMILFFTSRGCLLILPE